MEAEKNLRKGISEKLKDETLRDALGRFSEAYPIARAKAYENAGDIETLVTSHIKLTRYPYNRLMFSNKG